MVKSLLRAIAFKPLAPSVIKIRPRSSQQLNENFLINHYVIARKLASGISHPASGIGVSSISQTLWYASGP
jgi:hypothetical protein